MKVPEKLHKYVCLFLPSTFRLTAREPILTLSPNFEERMREVRQRRKPTPADLCNMLGLHRKQKHLCRRGQGVAETLVRATRLSALECQHQFQHERWNCTLGKYRMHILERGIKETSFLYAVSSAGLVHEFARACAQGILDRCTCDESKHLENTKTWLWGGCGDNIKFGLKFTRKFLRRARRADKDIRAKVDVHNSGAGIKIVKDLVNTTCKCHGVSGSCTVRTCWLQLSPFKTVGNVLKSKYEKSAKVLSFPNQAAGKRQLMKRLSKLSVAHRTSYNPLLSYSSATSLDMTSSSPMSAVGLSRSWAQNSFEEVTGIVPLRRTDLTYIEDSPSFCRGSRYSPGTFGRSCIKGDNCDSICCGRGYNVQRRRVRRACKCEVIWCCKVKCKQCISDEEVYLCK
ncbi:protein Wnt-9a [Aplysia californica]|uniref:Protein Wnt n=1 Tax=Aplysia californica TaxID=6500 RepID=A0ABM0JH75_APLCA|nr:protein Wnt-9a [Aplysia californica]